MDDNKLILESLNLHGGKLFEFLAPGFVLLLPGCGGIQDNESTDERSVFIGLVKV